MFILTFLVAPLGYALSDPSNIPLHLPKIHTAILDNGLQIMVVENNRAPVILHAITYKVGAMDELPSERGIAHLLEHMMFRGTSQYSEERIIQMLQRFGNNNNASTSDDGTRYYHTVQPQYLKNVMALEASRMQNLTINAQKFTSERNVVREERNQRLTNTKRSLIREESFGLLFRSHPYQNPVIGFHNDITNLSVKKTIAFYKKHYRPNNAVVTIVGDVKWQDVLRLAKKYYDPLTNPASYPAANDAVFFEPPQQSYIQTKAEDEKATTSSVSLIWKIPSLTSDPALLAPDDFRMQFFPNKNPKDITSKDMVRHAFSLMIASSILSDTSGDFYQTLVEKQGLASNAGAFQSVWNRGPGRMGIYVQAASKETSHQTLKDALDLALENLPHLISKKNVASAKNTILLSMAYSIDSLESLSLLLGELFLIKMTPKEFEKNITLFRSISREEVLSNFSMYVKDTPYMMNIISPPSPKS